jgi:hypothetical protein
MDFADSGLIQFAPSLCRTFCPYIALQKFSMSSLLGAFFHIGICGHDKLVKFLAVCSKHFILVVLFLSFLLSRQSLCLTDIFVEALQ